MTIDFATYPPEINSARLYAGPGPGPMLAAAQAWGSLADELYITGSGYQSVVSELTETAWSGPSAAAMSSAAQRYLRWLAGTAAHAEHTAAQARRAAAAYEAAFVATVPPAEVAANRSLLAVLVATNILGQNTPAIAATEALYAEMWAQDALAMYDYAGSSAAAVVLRPFSSPYPNTDPGAAADQVAAVSRSSGAVADAAGEPLSLVPQLLSALTVPVQGDQFSPLASLMAVFINAPGDVATLTILTPADALTGYAEIPPAIFATVSGSIDDDTISGLNGQEAWPGTAPTPVQPFRATLPNPPAGVLRTPTVTAALGTANTVVKLSVPPSWTAAAPELRPLAYTPPLADGASTVAVAPAPFDAATVEQAMLGQAMAEPPPSGAQPDAQPAHRARPSRHTAGTPDGDGVTIVPAPRTVATGVAAAIRDIASQRAQGLLTEQEYQEHRKSLLHISHEHP